MLSARNIAALGFMTFAMYLGAGNLIFPSFLGYQAGDNLFQGMAGFLLAGVGLPAFALVIVALAGGSDNLTSVLPRPLATTFWIMVFIVIGPAFVIPRAITVAYQFGFSPFFGDNALGPFSIIFCIIAVLFSLYPGKLVDNLGKWLTPALMAILLAMAIAALLFPSQGISQATGAYVSSAFAEGVTQGYMTMDALGSIGFGWVIFRAIKSMGVTQPKAITRYTLIAALMYAVAMALVYISLAYIGASSVGEYSNGGDILTTFTTTHFGILGTLLLGAVMILACLTTIIGVTTAGSEFYSRTFSKVSYRNSVLVTMIIGALVANIGLEQLLQITQPVVVALHPIAIALLLIAPLRRLVSMSGVLATLAAALIFGALDALHILGSMPASLDAILNQYLPLYACYAAWIVPTVIVLAIATSLTLFARSASARVITENSIELPQK